jgi:hypothetical protein
LRGRRLLRPGQGRADHARNKSSAQQLRCTASCYLGRSRGPCTH